MTRDAALAEPVVPAGSAPEGEAAPVRRPIFHVFEEFYRRAIRAETRPVRPASRTS